MKYSENELISEIKKRNSNAYESLIQQYTKPIYYLAYNILKINCSKSDLEECVSDVLLDIWLKIDEFDCDKGSFKTWILILTRYKALEYKRRITKTNVENIDDYQIEDLRQTEKQIIGRETQETLIKTIDTFNKVDKELFIRRYFMGEKIDILAQALGLSRSAVDNRLLRGRKILKEVLSNE